MTVNVLAVTDQIDQRIYSPTLRQRMPDVDLVISCGDLPARYLEFLADALDRPVYYVLGNHAEELTRGGEKGKRYYPLGCIDLGGKVIRDESTGLIFAGIPGSPKYNDYEPVQFTEFQVMRMMWRMAPRLLLNKLRYGRALDVLVTHAPPRDINDQPDVAHRGFKAIRRFLQKYRPRYHLHGHVHLYDRSKPHTADFADTHIINVYPFQKLNLEFSDRADATNPTPANPASLPSVPSATSTSSMPTAAAPADPISH
jgi:hypothetical protein